MKKILFFSLCFSVVLASCSDLFNNYGKKVKVNDKSTVYYKGDGVTEADAKKLGDFLLKDLGVFNTTDDKSVQLQKDGDAYVVRVVIKEGALEKNREGLLKSFWIWQDLISEGAFDGKKTKIILTDNKFKNIETLDEINKVVVGKGFKVYYKGKISEKEAEDIAEKLEKEGFLEYFGENAVLLSREKGSYVIRFRPAADKAANKENYYKIISNFQYLLTKYVIKDDVKMILIDEDLTDDKEFADPDSEMKAQLDQRMNTPQQTAPAYDNQNQPLQQEQPEINGGPR